MHELKFVMGYNMRQCLLRCGVGAGVPRRLAVPVEPGDIAALVSFPTDNWELPCAKKRNVMSNWNEKYNT